MKLCGSLNNRLEENRMFCDTIEVGTGMTEYLYTDRHAYEVVEVTDQKHIKVREYDHKCKDGFEMSNNWELVSNENNPIRAMTKRGKYWYWTTTITSDIVEEYNKGDAETRMYISLFLAQNGVSIDDFKTKKKITRYHRANVSFGVASYYFDYEF